MFLLDIILKSQDYPPLVGDPKLPNNIIVVTYQYWSNVRHNWYNEEEVTNFIEKEIIKETNDMRLVNLSKNMKKSQNISIEKKQI